MELQGKIALITGASRGIGPYIAKSLAQKGMTIIAVARSEKGLQITQSEVESNGGICHVQPFDLTNINGVEDFINDVWLKHGSIHVLVNNAGVEHYQHFDRLSKDEISLILKTNLCFNESLNLYCFMYFLLKAFKIFTLLNLLIYVQTCFIFILLKRIYE